MKETSYAGEEAMTTRVFCKDCKHVHRYTKHEASWGPRGRIGETCKLQPRATYHPIHGERLVHIKCVERNSGFDCELFEKLADKADVECQS